MIRAVFLDRDGVITQEPPHYAHKISQLHLIPNTAKAIKILNQQGFKVIIITNQAGIAKGYFKEEDTHIFNKELVKRLHKKGAHIDAIYFCPHHQEAVIEEYKKFCNCRKPNIGLIKEAAKEFNLDLEASYFIGDKESDILTGLKAGCKTILVKTGQGKDELKNKKMDYYYTANNLYAAVMTILQ